MICGNCLQGKDLSPIFWAELGVDPNTIEQIVITVEGAEDPVRLEIRQWAQPKPMMPMIDAAAVKAE
jgi:hypothetical protein